MSVEQALAEAPSGIESSEPTESADLSSAADQVATPSIPKAAEAPKSSKKKYNLVVDGNNEDFEFDPSNDEEVKKMLQKSKGADKKFQEASSIRQAAMDFVAELKKNPKKMLSDPNIGIDVRKFAEEILQQEIQEMEKTPEQREIDKYKKELEDLRKRDKDNEEKAKRSEFEKLQLQEQQRIETDITTALDMGGIPKTPRVIKQMAEYAMIALDKNINLSMKEVAQIVKGDNVKEFKDIINALSDDQLDDFLGKEVLGRLRKKNVAKSRAVQTASSVKETGTKKSDAKESSSSKQTYKSFFGKI